MKYKIQFISSYGKIHDYRFIRAIFPDSSVDIYSDTGYASCASKEIKDYYMSHKVSLIKAESYDSVHCSLLRHILNLICAIKIIVSSGKKEYDYCLIHFLSMRRAILSLFLPGNRKTILVTYGSDILRNKKLDSFIFRTMFSRAYKIIVTSGNIRYTIEKAFKNKYKDKTVYIPFPCASFDELDDVLRSTSKTDALRFFGLPDDKLIVVCGHTSTHDEQFEKLIPVLSSCNKSLLDRFHFVFPMTYGNGDYIAYRGRIKEMLRASDLSFTLLEEYIPHRDMTKLHIASDIHITTITTDALSFFLLEELYCDSWILYGSWLHYTEFETDKVNTIPFDEIPDIPRILQLFCDKKIERKADLDTVQKYIKEIQSPDTINHSWKSILESPDK